MALLPYNTVVTSAATSKDLTVLATVTTELGSPAADNAFISVLIQQASSKAVELSGRDFAAETLTEYFRLTTSDPMLQLSRRPIKSVTSVVEDGITLAGTDYEIIAQTGWLQRLNSDGDSQAWATAKIVIVYIAGYTMLTEESHALERIVIDEIKRLYVARARDPQLKSESVYDVASFTYQANGFGQGKDPMLQALEDQGFIEPII